MSVATIQNVFVRIMHWLTRGFANLRHATGDDAYERYVAHQRVHHAEEAVLDRRAYYLTEQQRKWTGVKRCC